MKKFSLLAFLLVFVMMFSSCGLIFDALTDGGNGSPVDTYQPEYTVPTSEIPVYTQGTEPTEEIPVFSDPDYDETEPTVNVLDLPGITENPVTVEPYEEIPAYSVPVNFLVYEGNISGSNAAQSCTFVAPETGVYYCGFDMMSGFTLEVEVLDSKNNRVVYDSHVSGGYGVTCDLVKDETYKVLVSYDNGTGDYTLSIGQQKATVDITGATYIADAIEFNNQENYYLYTPELSGTYYVYISEINSDCVVSLYVFDAQGYTVTYDSHVSRGYGLTVDLEAGQTYKFAAVEYEGMGGYTLSVGPQKPTVDISGYTHVADSIQFNNQVNYYVFCAPVTGIYRIELAKINSGNSVAFEVCDAQGYRVMSDSSVYGGNGISVDVTGGSYYTLSVTENEGYVPYTIFMGAPEEAVDITGYSVVNHSVEFNYQENRYTFTAPETKEYAFGIANAYSGFAVGLYVYDSAGYQKAYDSSVYNGDRIIADLVSGETYTVCVSQDSEFGAYSLTVE